MEAQDPVGERTFRVNFSEDGTAKLTERLADVLKEYMGDYVDETLVKYIIVLLGNGRRKEEVKEDLDVFLGDKTDSFVTWLWDHLASNLDQYVQSHGSPEDEVVKAKPESVKPVDKTDSDHLVTDSERAKSNKSSRSRHNREWKGLTTDDAQPPPLRSSVTYHIEDEQKAHRNAVPTRQSVSPEPPVHRKRNYPEERPRLKREVSQPTIAASRRLLQFAVREAVATKRPCNSVSESSQKRLRSVVSTSTDNSTEEAHPRKIRSVARLPNPLATAIKAVAEAAEDVKKVRTGNVFDRLSRGVDVQESIEQVSAFREPEVQDLEFEDYDQYEKARQRFPHARGDNGRHINAFMMDSSSGRPFDSASDNEGYNDVNVMSRRVTKVSETVTSGGNKADDSLMVQYSVAQNTDDMMGQSRKKDQEQPVSAANTKHKIVNISVNVNTWKPPHYQPSREIVEAETQKSTKETDTGAGNSNARVMKENSNPLTVVANGKAAVDVPKANLITVMSSAPGPYSTGRPLEDADSRMVFVNNVHFAATKDTLSQHFNKFGEVLKVIILTDAATGHPKGSAYVEFLRKEAAENALSLDGTSFMSRIIKVVKKSSAQQEASPKMIWPRITRSSPFAVPRFGQAPFPRVYGGSFRARPPIKLGARSMQWKRDAQQTSAESVTSGPNTTSAPLAGRGLTYIRTESKSDGNPGRA